MIFSAKTINDSQKVLRWERGKAVGRTEPFLLSSFARFFLD